MPDATLRIQVLPHAFPLRASTSLIGEGTITLATPDNVIRMTVPVAAWPWLEPGQELVGSLTLFRVAIDQPPAADLSTPGLIIAGGEN